MNADLDASYRATDYRVRPARGGWNSLRIDQTPPPALRALIGGRSWGFVTAWNPASRPRDRQSNRLSQRALLADLRALPDSGPIRAGVGVGPDGWRECSLFVVGPGRPALEALARRYGQLAFVHGRADGSARLCWVAA